MRSVAGRGDAAFRDLLAGARMQRHQHRDFRRQRAQRAENVCEQHRVVGVLGAVHRREDIAARRQAEPLQQPAAVAGKLHELQRRVIHHVARAVYAVGDPFAAQVIDRGVGRREQQAGDVVGENAVGLLRHRPVERAQARLDVRDRNAELDGRERPSQRRVGVAVDQQPARLLLQQHLLDGLEHAPGHRAVRQAADAELVARLRDAHLPEKHLRHQVVVVLAGMHQDFLDAALRERARHRRRLDELRPRADHGDDFHPLTCRSAAAAAGSAAARSMEPCPIH